MFAHLLTAILCACACMLLCACLHALCESSRARSFGGRSVTALTVTLAGDSAARSPGSVRPAGPSPPPGAERAWTRLPSIQPSPRPARRVRQFRPQPPPPPPLPVIKAAVFALSPMFEAASFVLRFIWLVMGRGDGGEVPDRGPQLLAVATAAFASSPSQAGPDHHLMEQPTPRRVFRHGDTTPYSEFPDEHRIAAAINCARPPRPGDTASMFPSLFASGWGECIAAAIRAGHGLPRAPAYTLSGWAIQRPLSAVR